VGEKSGKNEGPHHISFLFHIKKNSDDFFSFMLVSVFCGGKVEAPRKKDDKKMDFFARFFFQVQPNF